jgi:hypothetical protein
VSTSGIVIAGAFFVIGFCAHIAWEGVCNVLADLTGFASSVFWDILAVIGIITVIAGTAYIWQHYH